MRIDLRHTLRYRYEPAVFIEPIVVRLRPRCDYAHDLLSFALNIDPAPAGKAELLDALGNVVTCAWFEGQHESLLIESRAHVALRLENPFNYLIIDPEALMLPLSSHAALIPALEPFRRPHQPDPAVRSWADALREEAGGHTQQFLMTLLREIHQNCEFLYRDEGDPWPPGRTLQRRRGACRDLAVLFTEACRTQGLASRFVSGYQLEEQVSGERQLHAWSEVYLPGAGWRGYDPTYGLVVANQHIALAAGLAPEEAAPAAGAFRRTGARSSLTFRIEIEETS